MRKVMIKIVDNLQSKQTNLTEISSGKSVVVIFAEKKFKKIKVASKI